MSDKSQYEQMMLLNVKFLVENNELIKTNRQRLIAVEKMWCFSTNVMANGVLLIIVINRLLHCLLLSFVNTTNSHFMNTIMYLALQLYFDGC